MEENTVLKIKICDGNHKSATLLACFIENFEICCLPSLTLSHVCVHAVLVPEWRNWCRPSESGYKRCYSIT